MSSNQLHNISTNDSAPETVGGTALIVVESCIFILLDFAAIVGNSLVCTAFYRNPSLRTVTNYFVLSLALTDLSIAVLIIPLSTISTIANTVILGDFECRIRFICGYILASTSVLTIMLLAINRYLHVTRAALCRLVYTKRRSLRMTVSAWTVSVVVVMVMFFISGIQFQRDSIKPSLCLWVFSKRSGPIIVRVVPNIIITVCSLVIAVCSVKVYHTIRQHNITVSPSSEVKHSPLGVEQAKVTRILTAVVVGFYICFLPPFISNILRMFGYVSKLYYNFYFVFPGFTSSVINPLMYAIMSKPFRKEFRKILC